MAHKRNKRNQDRRHTERTVSNVDSTIWRWLSMAMFVLAIIVLAILLLYGRGPSEGDQTAKSQKTTPAPSAVPQTPK